ncbi:hypothetical protein [Actinomadura rupiterrae]|uniref:hypothetical protein n=1 Tax=Actinomadura rupiterrae TaxID=559627 RepID=UPI0020A23810|nr:hypothetical protein [Actinomadura rupiterrae]MCP2341592.1 hypothetical protein [Actinomadura rupiterrae]
MAAESSARSGRGGLAGCAAAGAALLGGFALGALQNRDIIGGWTYCSGLAAGAVVDSGDSFGLGFGLLFFRLPGYTLCLVIGGAAGMRLTRGRPRSVRVAAALAGAFLLAGLAFWGDYALNNGLGPMDVSRRCPQGRPPWWPSWVPLSIRT